MELAREAALHLPPPNSSSSSSTAAAANTNTNTNTKETKVAEKMSRVDAILEKMRSAKGKKGRSTFFS